MKKTYMHPSMKVISVSTHSMLCGSLDPDNLRGTVSEQSVTNGTAAESRRGSFWDDED